MLKYRLITALILIPVVIGALFLLPPVGFAIVTLVVCMLAAWEWGQLAGFASRSQRIWFGRKLPLGHTKSYRTMGFSQHKLASFLKKKEVNLLSERRFILSNVSNFNKPLFLLTHFGERGHGGFRQGI